MEKNNSVNNVVDEVIEHVKKGEKLKEKALKKIKQDKDIRKYVSDVFSLIVGVLVVLIVFELPNLIGYFYLESINPFKVAGQVLYLVILFVLLVHNYITLRKINNK